MNLVNEDFSIRFLFFKCLDTGNEYRISGSETTFKSHEFWKDSARFCVDLITREDGIKKKYTREELKRRFKNVQEVSSKLSRKM